MSRGPPHRYTPGDERSFRRYQQRYGEFSGSSSYGYYGGPPYKRQRHLSDEDICPPPGADYSHAAYFDPPYVRHQEVGLGDYNDFSSISEKDMKMEREGIKKEFERSELHTKKWQTSSEGSGYSTSAPSSPHSRVSPKISPRLSPRVGPSTPPSSTSQPTPVSISTSGQDLSKSLSPSFSDEAASFSRHHSLQVVCTTSSSLSSQMYGAAVHEKIRDSTGRPALISPSASDPQKDSYPGPTIEAISPSAPGSEGQSEEKKAVTEDPSDLMSKDELLQGMEKVDREISQVEQQINNLKKKQKQLEEEASKQPSEPPEEELPPPTPKPKSIVQKIYEENQKKAETAEARLAKLSVPLPGGKPLYNQPSDLPCYHENLRKAPAIKAKLVKYFQLRKQAKELKNRQLCKEYKTLKQAWLKKIERNENNPKRKQKEAKLREFYEKVFPEIRKQREQTERFARMGSRSNWGIVARSEAEFNEIVDNLNEQEANERHMRTLAVEPPPLLDKEERRVKFINRNGLIRDPLATLNERKHKNIWTEKERLIFKDKFIHNPKDFDFISSFLPGKSVGDCILFYYQTKKKEHYKQLSRRHNLKKRRRDQFGNTREATPTNKSRGGISESGTKGGFEGDDDLGEITDSAEESEENEEQPVVTTAQVTTPTPSVRHTGRPDHVETSRWSEKEIEIALQGLRECGRDWEAIARRVVTKTGAQCKNFYFNYKRKLRLEDLVAEHEATKMQRAQEEQRQQRALEERRQQLQQQQQQEDQKQQQQQQQQHQQPQQQQQLQPYPHPQEHHKDSPGTSQRREPNPKHTLAQQPSESHSSHSSDPHNKPGGASNSNVSSTSGKESTSVIVSAVHTAVGSPKEPATTSSVASSISNLQRIVPSHSPHLSLTSSSSTLFMPTPGVIASIGRASPNVGTGQPTQVYTRHPLPEYTKPESIRSSRSPHPETVFPGIVYPRPEGPRSLQSDLSHLRAPYLVSPRPGYVLSDSRPIYHGSATPKSLGYSTNPPHTATLHTASSPPSLTYSNKGVLLPGSSHPIMSHPGISLTSKSHVSKVYGQSSHPSEPIQTPSGSSVFAPSGVINTLGLSRPASHSPVPAVSQSSSDEREKSPSQPLHFPERLVAQDSSVKPSYLYQGSARYEPSSGSILQEASSEVVKKNSRIPESASYVRDVPKPDVIVIEDDQKKRMEGFHRLDTGEGKQASSMLRMLASGGNGPTSSGDHVPPVTEPVRPQSLPLSSSNRIISHTDLRSQQSATPPSNFAMRPQTLNPPPPLIQVPSSRDKKYITAHELSAETTRPREGFAQGEAYHDRYRNVGQETSTLRDVPRRAHTPVDNRGGEREKRSVVVETVDLTSEREVSSASLVRPTAISPAVAQGSSSARAHLQAMARYALAETSSPEVTEKMGHKRKEETYLPPRHPDVKLTAYEKNEAIRKYKLGTVCLSAPREVPVGGEYSSQAYGLMPMPALHQPLTHTHPHPAGTSTPPPYGYPFHMGHPVGTLHHHPEHRFLVPVGVPVRELLPHSVNGEDLPSHVKLSGAFAHQYPQGAAYYPASLRPVVPTYQPMSVCGHPYSVPLGEERRAVHHPLEVSGRRQNEISEQELANPFVVKQQRHMHAPGMPEKVVSSGELSTFPLSSRSPKESAPRSHALSPEMKPKTSAHTEEAKTVSPPTSSYLSRIPSRPASVSEMRNRAAVIPELGDTEGSVKKFPDPQPLVIMPTSEDCQRENSARLAQEEFVKETKDLSKEDKEGSMVESSQMAAFATLVDVAAAARKVDVPVAEHLPQKEASDVRESPPVRQGGHTAASHTRVKSPPSPSRASPGASTPRYGITTGLVPKPPPLMPITGMRPLQEGSNSSTTPISVSIASHGTGMASRSPSKLTSPPGARSARASVSPDGPPPLISHTVISPTSSSPSQGMSSKGPPPLIKGIVSPVSMDLRSPENIDNSRKTTSNPDSVVALQRSDQEPAQLDRPSIRSVQNMEPDIQRKVGQHLQESPQTSSHQIDDKSAKRPSSLPQSARLPQVRTIFETINYVDSTHAELRHPSRLHMNPSQPPFVGMYREEDFSPVTRPSNEVFTEITQREGRYADEMPRSWTRKETESEENVQPPLQSDQSFLRQYPAENVDQRGKESWQAISKKFPSHQKSQSVSSDEDSAPPQRGPSTHAPISHGSGSETEEGDEGDMETEDGVPPVHPRILALARRSSQGHSQSPYYEPSDSETLSAEESENLPESSDEMLLSSTMTPCTQSYGSSEVDKPGNHESFYDDKNKPNTNHTSTTSSVCNPSASGVSSVDEDVQIDESVSDCDERQESVAPEDVVTSTKSLSEELLDVKGEDSSSDSPTASSSVVAAAKHLPSSDPGAEEEETNVGSSQKFHGESGVYEHENCYPSQSSPSPIVEVNSLVGLPEQASSGIDKYNTVTVECSEDVQVGSSETDRGTDVSQFESSEPQTSQEIPDSSANLENRPDRGKVSPSEKNDNIEDDGITIVPDENALTTVQPGLTQPSEVTSVLTDEQSVSPSERGEGNYICQSAPETENNNVASTLSDQENEEYELNEETREADALENSPQAEHGFLVDPDTYSSPSDTNHPEISSAIDCVSDDNEQVSYPTFVGAFVPLPGEVASPDVRSGGSTQVPSDEGSVCDEVPADKEVENTEQTLLPKVEPLNVLSPNEEANHTDDTLSEGEIPPSQESSQSEDEPLPSEGKPLGSKATSLLHDDPITTPQSTKHPETTPQMSDCVQLPSHSKESEDDDQLSEGEIRESEDEPTTESYEESSSSNANLVSSSMLGRDGDTCPVPDRVSSSKEATTRTECYINMIPISPAPPESPSHPSRGDRASPLPPWPFTESHHPSVVPLAARMTFPYSSLSLNVGSASSSARSSPVPHSFAVNLAPGSSPSSSSLLSRPQEPAPLLSDSYEPLSDDEVEEMADNSTMRDEQDL